MKPDNTDTPPPAPPPHTTQWRALGELADSATASQEASLDEFPEGAAEFTDEVSRRKFLALMGASMALATGAGCYVRPAPQRKILPYTTQPDEITPGVPLYFATAAPLAGYGTGVLVRSNEGRPTKVEGNPDHPSSLGGAGLFALASVLDLYDPDRARGVTHLGQPSSFEQAMAATRRALSDPNTGQPRKTVRLRILTETVTSPTLAAQINTLLTEFPEARWAQFDAADRGNVREGARRAFGKPLNVTYDFNKADVVLALDSDFLTCGPGATRYSRDFSDRRKIRKDGKDAAAIAAGRQPGKPFAEGVKADQLNRLYAVECTPTPTGSVAEHRLPLPAGQIEVFARALAAKLGVGGVPALGGVVPEAARAWIDPLAADLLKSKGKSVVVVGEHQPASLHALAHAINAALDNLGKTVFASAPVEVRPEGKVLDLKTLTEEMNKKQVDVLLVFGVNAAYTAPNDIPFARAVREVPFALYLGTHQDETAVLCPWHVHESHYLETWGDIRGHDGTVAIQQPLIGPLYKSHSAIELIAAVLGGPAREGYDIVRDYWKGRFADEKRQGEFDAVWQEWVRTGVVAGFTPAHDDKATLAKTWAEGSTAAGEAPSEGKLEINFRPDPTIFDGRFANNGWLQELPKPLLKMTWDNAVYLGPKTAEKLGIEKSYAWTAGERGRSDVTVVELDFRGNKVKAPAWVLPGHPENSLTVHLGYGRTRVGKVAVTPDEPNAAKEGTRGFNAYALRPSDAPWFATGATLAKTSDSYILACTQAHWRMVEKDVISGRELDRKPVRHGTLADYKNVPEFAQIPPTAAGETHEINKNVPGQGGSHDHDHNHEPTAGGKEKHGNGEHGGHNGQRGHDSRLVELTMYNPNDVLVPGARKEQQRRWAMAIDLAACTGCSACVVACQGENNIPVVGKEQVTKAREMHWLRIDRYYEGSPENPETYFQPLACVQCEKAPCEIVCPVGATVHSADGLNDMTYNRCVGTRYCSNNCPYKVRRFNFLTFQDWSSSSLKLGRNPDVTVRSRGVMEKCTFCVQRIRGAEIVAEREGRTIKDGEILTACQSACPSGAIVFGDLNDAHSAVSKWKTEPTNYGLLAELNTMPRLTHLAVIRNPNPAMPKGA